MKKRTPVVPQLPPDATDEEIIRWTETYDLGSRLDAGISEIVEIHEPSIQDDDTAQLILRVPTSMKKALQKIARRQTTRTSTLARRWLAERLQKELQPQKDKKPRGTRLRASS